MLKVAFLCVYIQLSNSLYYPLPPICQRRVLVPEAAVVQPEDLTAHYVSPLKSDRGEKYVNQDTVDFSHVPPVPSLTIFIHRPCLATVTYNDPFC